MTLIRRINAHVLLYCFLLNQQSSENKHEKNFITNRVSYGHSTDDLMYIKTGKDGKETQGFYRCL